jgi:hypothetical protein
VAWGRFGQEQVDRSKWLKHGFKENWSKVLYARMKAWHKAQF